MDVIERCFWQESVENIFLALDAEPAAGPSGEWAKAQSPALAGASCGAVVPAAASDQTTSPALHITMRNPAASATGM